MMLMLLGSVMRDPHDVGDGSPVPVVGMRFFNSEEGPKRALASIKRSMRTRFPDVDPATIIYTVYEPSTTASRTGWPKYLGEVGWFL